jgi:hypothetical protein
MGLMGGVTSCRLSCCRQIARQAGCVEKWQGATFARRSLGEDGARRAEASACGGKVGRATYRGGELASSRAVADYGCSTTM